MNALLMKLFRSTTLKRLGGIAVLGGSLTAPAATFPVISLADSGPGSLREAVGLANGNPGPDTIDLTGVTGTISLTSGALLLSEATTFNGPGKDRLTIDGNYNGRIITGLVGGGGPYHVPMVDVTVAGLTLARAAGDDLPYRNWRFLGGAIVGATVTATDCDFRDSYVPGVGAAIGALHVRLTRCAVTGNIGGTAQPAVATYWSAVAVDCRFEGNGAALGNAEGEPTLDLTRCEFINNGIAVGYSPDLRVRDCVFRNNGYSIECGASVDVANSLFVTGADPFGSNGSWSFHLSDFVPGGTRQFANCTFINVWEPQYGLGPFFLEGFECQYTFANCIFRGRGAQLSFFASSPTTVLTTAHCNWEGPLDEAILSWPEPSTVVDLGGQSFGDPLFVDAANGDYRLLPASPCVNAGRNDLIPAGVTLDLLGNPRISGAAVDLGAFETVLDVLPPVITTPGDVSVSATSTAGAVVDFDVSALDDVDGAVAVSCVPASGSTFPLGTTTVTCTATDAAGNLAESTFTVTVRYEWSGLLQPISANGSSVFKAGSTVPVKFRLGGASAGITTVAARLTFAKVNNGVVGVVNEAVVAGNGSAGNVFRYDPASDQYGFSWSTRGLTAGVYQLSIDLGDGLVRRVVVVLR